jgi:arsenate reductase (glutaredoxin)
VAWSNREDLNRGGVKAAMNIQIFGIKKCQDTRKAERYFKERAVPYQYIDLTVRGLSKGELSKVQAAVGRENLVDKAGKEYAKRNLKYIVHDEEEVLLAHPLLLRTPIVRNGPQATVGYCPEIWQGWS